MATAITRELLTTKTITLNGGTDTIALRRYSDGTVEFTESNGSPSETIKSWDPRFVDRLWAEIVTLDA